MQLTDLRSQSLRRFGELLRQVCEVAGLTQGKLAKRAKAELDRLLACGEIRADDALGSMEQSTVSRVMAGLQAPTYFQVFIWLRVIKAHYQSDLLTQRCEALGIAVPTFSADLERILWKLSLFLSPDELASLYEKSQNEQPLCAHLSLIEHKEERMREAKEMVAAWRGE